LDKSDNIFCYHILYLTKIRYLTIQVGYVDCIIAVLSNI